MSCLRPVPSYLAMAKIIATQGDGSIFGNDLWQRIIPALPNFCETCVAMDCIYTLQNIPGYFDSKT
jgi:hypothetical protein